MPEQIEQYMRTLKLGGMAQEWRSVAFQSTEQYVRELLELELREREVNRINRMVKTAGFQVIASSQSPLISVSACGENCARFLAPPSPIEPAALGFDWGPECGRVQSPHAVSY